MLAGRATNGSIPRGIVILRAQQATFMAPAPAETNIDADEMEEQDDGHLETNGQSCPPPAPASERSSSEESAPDGRARVSLSIEGMSCASCADNVEEALMQISGVTRADVNLATERADVTVNPDGPPVHDLIRAVEDRGYGVRTTETTLTVQGMSCASCSASVESAVESLSGVTEASVNLATDRTPDGRREVGPSDHAGHMPHRGAVSGKVDTHLCNATERLYGRLDRKSVV